MCLIFISVHHHSRYKLILAANRDEFYTRKTTPAQFWPNHPQIVGGRDLEAMKPDGTCGTWMAVNKNGRVAMVTNYRDLKNIKSKAPSRGYLVTDYLLSNEAPEEYLQKLDKHKASFNGFNLIVGTPDQFYYLSNYKEGVEKIENGFHGLSNHLLDTPWPKVKRGGQSVERAFGKDRIVPGDLLDKLYDTDQADDNELPDTGVGLERERMLSSMFIKSPNYGTRCSTVVTIDQDNELEFTERSYDLKTFDFEDRSYRFAISPL